MGHQHHRLALSVGVQALRQQCFGPPIHRAGRLVQQQDRRVVQHGPRYANTLTLPTREQIAPLPNRHIKTPRVVIDPFQHPGRLGRCDHRQIVRTGMTPDDVLAQTAGK